MSRRRGQGGRSAGRSAQQRRRFSDKRGKGAGGERGGWRSLEITRGDCHGPSGVELLEDFLEVLECRGGHDIAAKGILGVGVAKASVDAHESEVSAFGAKERGGHLADGGTNDAGHQVDRGRVGDNDGGVLHLGSMWHGVGEHGGSEID